ncbi:ABC transporter permease [Parafilimonas sp.]|uniref:ABC transporter permease n=1 Tax=Parafilimonas sp. TaxID=1969739 RepID=UPI0039E33700
MFRNYLKIGWRNLLKNKTFSIINIVGLATGLACFLIIALYVLDELSYDRFTKNADRIYRINADIRFGGGEIHGAISSDMMGQVLKKDYPQVEQYTRIYNFDGYKLIKKGNNYIKEEKVANVDSTFFDVFTFPAISGNTHTALNEPNTVVITESVAKKYFPQDIAHGANVTGKTLEVQTPGDNKTDVYKITAIIKDMPENSHFNYNFLFPMKNVSYEWGRYASHNFHTYLLLAKGTDYKAFEKKFDDYTNRYVLPYVQQFVKITSMDEFKKAGNKLEYSLTPLTKIHLYSDYQFELAPGGNIQYVYIFSAVALFILLIACVNFMNLTTARSANRAKEVGIRKVLGTEKRELILQFLSESVLMVCLSLIIAIGMAWLVMPLFNSLANKIISVRNLFSPAILLLLVALPVIVGLIAGSYPAFFLSSFRPVEVLKGKLKMGNKSGGLRSVLVVFQFATSIFLIIGTIIIYKQLHFIQTKDIGFNKDQVLIINDAFSLGGSTNVFKEDITKISGVQSATISPYLPVSNSSRSDNTYFSGPSTDVKNGFDMQNWSIDENYIPTMGMQLIKGRNFSKDFPSDSSAMIVNETVAKFLNRKDPLNTKIYGQDDSARLIPYNIIGVVKNFNFESLHQNVGPLCFRLRKRAGSYVAFKVNAANISNIISSAENKWKALVPSMPFNYRFLDESFNEMYDAEQRVGKIALIFSVLAIAIACLGLFGLATFIAEQRTKEIGIRKVLGASVSGIVQLLSKDFVKLVAIAFIIAVPLGWYFMYKWLQDFVYRISISWWMFAAAGITALFIALITVSFQAIKAALANPVKSLRTE